MKESTSTVDGFSGLRGAGLALRDRAVPIAVRTLLSVRRPTANRRLLPTYLIIGAQKCGTSFLQQALWQHPAVSRALKREVHFFDWNFDRGTDWYRAHFVTPRARQRSLRANREFATGEKSPYYLFDPAVPARVRALLPDVRIIVLLRNPVSRAYSHFHQETRRGHETLSFEEAIAAESRQGDPADPRRFARDSHRRSYVARGRYAEQLERWLGQFDRAQIHVTLSERLFADPAREIGEIERFIGLSPSVPATLRPWGRASYAPMPTALRHQLQETFAGEVARLTELLGESPGWW